MLLTDNKSIDVHDVVTHCIALKASNIHSVYIALYNRLRNFSRQVLEEYLYKSGSAGRFRGMRHGLFVIPQEYFELTFLSSYRQREYNIEKNLKLWDISETEYTRIAHHILNMLSTGEKTLSQVKRTLPPQDKKLIEIQHGKNRISSSNFEQVFNTLMDRWQVIPGVETWYNQKKRFCLFEALHPQPGFSMDYESAERELVLKYITNFGPVILEDIAWWCNLTTNRVQRILATLSHEINEVVITKKTYYIWSQDFHSFVELEDKFPDGCQFLGRDDPLLQAYHATDVHNAGKLRKPVISGFGESNPVVLINGKVTGTWNFKETNSSVDFTINLFQTLNARFENKLYFEIEKLGDFIGGEDKTSSVEIIYR